VNSHDLQLSFNEFLSIFPEFTGEIEAPRFVFLVDVLGCQFDCLGLGDGCGNPSNLFYLLLAHTLYMLCHPAGGVKSVKNVNSEDVFNVAATSVDDISLSQSAYGRIILDIKYSCYGGVPITGCC
jgi:hypothetical protein